MIFPPFPNNQKGARLSRADRRKKTVDPKNLRSPVPGMQTRNRAGADSGLRGENGFLSRRTTQ